MKKENNDIRMLIPSQSTNILLFICFTFRYMETINNRVKNGSDYEIIDESFISQFLSPKLMRDFKLFHIRDDDEKDYVEVVDIHNEKCYKKIRTALSAQYNLSNIEANIQVIDANVTGDRSLTLQYTPQQNVPLDNSCNEGLKHLYYLWQFDIKLIEEDINGKEHVIAKCPPDEETN